MVKVFHSSVIRRPSLHSDNPTLESNRTNGVVSQEMSLDDFINNVSNNNTNNSRHAMHSTTKSSRIEEMQDLDANFDRNATSDNTATNPDWISRNNATAFRRRNPTDDTNNHEVSSLKYKSHYNSFGHVDKPNQNLPPSTLIPHPNNDNHKQTPTASSNKSQNNSTWNKLNTTLFVGHALLSAATSVPVTLVPTMARSLAGTTDEEWTYYTFDGGITSLEVYDEYGVRRRWIPFRIRGSRTSSSSSGGGGGGVMTTASSFASRLAVIVTFATALGKFVNGLLVDISGARRLVVVYGLCTFLALLGLRSSRTSNGAIACCAAIEFFSSVFWPCAIVVLGAHYGISDVSRGNGAGPSDGRFERGINITSIASRCGSLLAMPVSSLLLKWTSYDWRDIAGFAAVSALMGVFVFYLFLTDSPGKLHDPQNPIRTIPHAYPPWSTNSTMSHRAVTFLTSAIHTVLPSLRIVLMSRVFWVMSAAHAAATMVKSSERVLGTYYCDTSYGMATEGKAGAMTVFLPAGMLGGLIFGGRAFARAADEERALDNARNYAVASPQSAGNLAEISLIDATQLRPKNMIAFLYCLAICMCYMLSFLAMPFIRRALGLPEIVLILQVLVTAGLGAGVAVQYYHIPAVVGATYGNNRGLYQAYTDGVAALVSSAVWRIVGRAVEEGNPEAFGWAYGWAAVALLLILCGTLMVGIMEVYFVGGGWRHHLTQHDRRHDNSFPSELPKDLNGSWMEDELVSTGLSLEDSSVGRRRRGIHILSTSAIEFLSPARPHRAGRSLLAVVDSPDEGSARHGREADLLGIDDDGSLLYPINTSVRQSQRNAHNELLGFQDEATPNLNHVSRNHIRDTAPLDEDTSTELFADYVSFINSGMLEPRKCLITFTNSEDAGSSIRETSCFEYPESIIEDEVPNNTTNVLHGSRDNRDAKTPPPIDSFSL
ncbi:hypothetical protein HJC23_012170 [Cyclotella cryptica]|uniref:Major facilitator superfamily (MFS) profile domain-containing protein n=1 Tax=Cyclotella cryptica TaxID=29204 RepID=A0ABD3P8W9_9STRA|eukprot:CCRYP_016652-RA/>CCRYP_016652-RA protein AED:0.02 eAED:0.02 QI:554/-1/1/1/-1/1/1/36/939